MLFCFQVLDEYTIDYTTIAALMFDTTSLNTGIKNGVIVRLEQMLGKPLFQLACRHHIFGLVCGAACSRVYGSTTGPTQAAFKKLISVWDSLDKNNCSSVQNFPSNRFLTIVIQDTIIFLKKWLENNADQTLRHDYHEHASLSLLFLSNIALDPKYTKVKAPRAIHNAR